jgi:hypothetical protein
LKEIESEDSLITGDLQEGGAYTTTQDWSIIDTTIYSMHSNKSQNGRIRVSPSVSHSSKSSSQSPPIVNAGGGGPPPSSNNDYSAWTVYPAIAIGVGHVKLLFQV